MFIWIIATLTAFYIKGLCGFANTLIFNSILSFSVNNINISPIELILGYPSNLILTWKNRKNLSLKIWLPLSLLVLAGNIPGALFLKNVDTQIIKIIFGFVIIFIGFEMLLREYSQGKKNSSKPLLIFIGFLSGILCGLFGVGALLAAYINRVTDNTDSFKANICAVFIVENSFRIILYGILGIINISVIQQALLLVLFMLIGLFLGIKSSHYIQDKFIKKGVQLLLILSGIMLVINNFQSQKRQLHLTSCLFLVFTILFAYLCILFQPFCYSIIIITFNNSCSNFF